MNYRHAYHAGNFADVLKHLTLIAVLERLCVKDTPLAYLDTHAGRGRYRLDSDAALASGEAAEGIQRLRESVSVMPGELLDDYFRLIDNERAGHGPNCYPGSPALAAQLLRPTDRLILAELEPGEAQALKQELGRDPRVLLRSGNGYGLLKSELPPKQRRGLILIDPPFERQADEFSDILNALAEGLTRFAHGVYAIWYPVKLKAEVDGFVRAVRKQFARPTLRIELHLYPPTTANRLNGAGMLLINPPFEVERRLRPALVTMAKALAVNSTPHLIVEPSP